MAFPRWLSACGPWSWALVLGMAAIVPGMARAAAAVKAVEVAENVWMVQGEAALGSSANRNFISNAGFVVTEEGVVVVDA
ncbi:MAG: MBL fold metallo-hydrolase, partial [Rhodoferax sp.]|nr:MBL fold metallo-hydrolase [Rhodoferax sp.]